MTTDHHAEAERLLSAISTHDWRDEHPYVDRRTNAAKAHALLALDDTLRTILCWEEPPEELLARVKAETLEKAAQEHQCDTGNFDRSLCAPPCDFMHSYCATCGERQDPCAHDENPAQDGENAPLAGAGHDQAPGDPQPAQTLADLTPCLGDRVRVTIPPDEDGVEMVYGSWRDVFCWMYEPDYTRVFHPENWTVLEHLPPVTPDEPPVGAGMLVDVSPPIRQEVIWDRDESGWRLWVDALRKWSVPVTWAGLMEEGFRFRPATPADLAEHGVDEQGEPVGKGEAVTVASVLHETADWLESMMHMEGGVGGPQSGYGRAGLDIIRLIRERAAKAGAR